MAKQHRRAPRKQPSAKTKVASTAAGTVGLPAPADLPMMVMDGNRPHETTLHDTTLEDFGLDVLRVVQPHRP